MLLHLATQRGATAEQVACLDAVAGFRYAGLLHISGNAIDDAAFAGMSAHFAWTELIELTVVAAAFEMFPRINSALNIPVTPLPAGE